MSGAELLFVNGRTYQPGDESSLAGGLAVGGGRIIATGSDADLAALAGAGTHLVDLQGGLLLPGFQDSHIHPFLSGRLRRQLDLSLFHSKEDLLAGIALWAREHQDELWIYGWGWNSEFFPQGLPHRNELDEMTGTHPAILLRADGHAGWANTEALKHAGLFEPGTPDPANGTVLRDVDGYASGVLLEWAADLVADCAPTPTKAELVGDLLAAQRELLAVGITGWQDASVFADQADVYAKLADSDELLATVVGALRWQDTKGLEQIEDLLATRARTARVRFRPTAAKILYDGVIDGSLTAALLEPYTDAEGKPTSNVGATFFEASALPKIVRTLIAADFQPHFHVIGDRATREALDSLELVAVELGEHLVAVKRPILSHIQLVHPVDVPRFAELGVVASVQPLWANLEPVQTDLTIPYIGNERSVWQYPFGDLLHASAVLAGGSDWPVSTPDPIQGIHVAVNRALPGDTAQLNPEQALTLADALTSYTLGSAYASHREDESGSLDIGKLADLVVLDSDPFLLEPEEIHTVNAVRTYISGVEVSR